MTEVLGTVTERAQALPPTASPSQSPIIRAEGIVKTFRPRQERHTTVRESVLHPLHRTSRPRILALRDVSLEVRRGELFGIVGRNGSGKSTLLRCLAGIYPVDSGELEVGGRVAPFIDLGIGFNPDLPARDNVLINAVILGMTPAEARRRLGEIIEFAGLPGFEEMKLKDFSSGMQVRLAFSVTVHVQADVLLFDEVLAVGDGAFRQKCLDRIDELRAEGRTTLLVTHDMSLLERCDRGMLLEEGQTVLCGQPFEVARRYRELNEAWVDRNAGGRLRPEGDG